MKDIDEMLTDLIKNDEDNSWILLILVLTLLDNIEKQPIINIYLGGE